MFLPIHLLVLISGLYPNWPVICQSKYTDANGCAMKKKKKGILVSSSFHACGGVFHSEYGTFSEGELWNCCSICCLSEHTWGSTRVCNSMARNHSHRRNKRSWIYLAMAFTIEMNKDPQDCVPLDGAKYNLTWAPCYLKAPAACCSSSPGKRMI